MTATFEVEDVQCVDGARARTHPDELFAEWHRRPHSERVEIEDGEDVKKNGTKK